MSVPAKTRRRYAHVIGGSLVLAGFLQLLREALIVRSMAAVGELGLYAEFTIYNAFLMQALWGFALAVALAATGVALMAGRLWVRNEGVFVCGIGLLFALYLAVNALWRGSGDTFYWTIIVVSLLACISAIVYVEVDTGQTDILAGRPIATSPIWASSRSHRPYVRVIGASLMVAGLLELVRVVQFLLSMETAYALWIADALWSSALALALAATGAALVTGRPWLRKEVVFVCGIGILFNLNLAVTALLHGTGDIFYWTTVFVSLLACISAVGYVAVNAGQADIPEGPPIAAAPDTESADPRRPPQTDWHDWLLRSLQTTGRQTAPSRKAAAFVINVLIVAVAVLLFTAIGDLAIPMLLRGASIGAILVVQIAWAIGVIVISVRIVSRLVVMSWQIGARNALEELMNTAGRRPILYLRPFHLDQKIGNPGWMQRYLGLRRTNTEQRMVSVLRNCGPVIAIGRPGERLPALGAARFYCDDAHWRAKVSDIVQVAQLVVWVAGNTKGLEWEISHLLEALAPEKLIIIPESWMVGGSADDREFLWSSFREKLGPRFPHPFPPTLGKSRCFYFRGDFEPIAVAPRWGVLGWLARPFRDGLAVALRQLLRSKMIAPFDRAGPIRAARRIAQLSMDLENTVVLLAFVTALYWFWLGFIRPYALNWL